MSDYEVKPALAGVSNSISDLGDMNVMFQKEPLWEMTYEAGLTPVGTDESADTPSTIEATGGADIPQTRDELGELVSSSYDLSVSQAGQLGIPVIGSVSGGHSRRVVVLEWTRFKSVPTPEGGEMRYGYAIRFCLTVNKWNADMKLSLPFLSAQAQIGNIEASWSLVVRALAGPKINAAALPPTELNVETFVLAQQSLKSLIAAADDPTTQFIPGIVISKTAPATAEQELRRSAVEAYGLYSIFRGRQEAKAVDGLAMPTPEDLDALRDTYEELGIAGVGDVPTQQQRDKAKMILNGIKADT